MNSRGNQQLKTNCATQTDIPQSQCQALVDLYHSTGGENWFYRSLGALPGGTGYPALYNWNVTNTPCSWTGVTCNGNVVTKIILSYSDLTGTLPNSLVNLTGLTELDLHNNQLTGTIPTLPTGLTLLDLSYNQLAGAIPSLPTGLTWLDLSRNQLTGIIPTLPTGLTDLNLSNNQLTGTIPTLPTGLTDLNLSNNQLTGTIPTLPIVLTYLNLHDNPLTGTLPALPAGLSYIGLSNTFVSIASSSSTPAAPSNNGIASEPMSNYGQVADNLCSD